MAQRCAALAPTATLVFTSTKGPLQYPKAQQAMLSGRTERLTMLVDRVFPSQREQDPARGLPPAAPHPTPHPAHPQLDRREQGKAEGTKAFWEHGTSSVSARRLVLTGELLAGHHLRWWCWCLLTQLWVLLPVWLRRSFRNGKKERDKYPSDGLGTNMRLPEGISLFG